MTPEQASWFARAFDTLVRNVEQAVIGKQHIVRLAFTCLLSEGHLLLEDFPGTGKTSLAKSIANSVKGTHSRIQFTPDLLPSDVTGVTIYDQRTGAFDFHGGPIFATIVLADEINRASPKTQSALLEVMEESHVTVDGIAHPVGQPFMVDRHPEPHRAGRHVPAAGSAARPVPDEDQPRLPRPCLRPSRCSPPRRPATAPPPSSTSSPRARSSRWPSSPTRCTWTRPSSATSASSPHESRQLRHVRLGLSVRGCLAYVRAAKTWAVADGRSYVVPDDIKELAVPILGHRLLLDAEAEFSGITVEDVIGQFLSQVRPPTERAA